MSEIRELAKKAERAAMRVEALAMMNMPQGYEERLEAAANYAEARAELERANAELSKAINNYARNKT